MISATPDLVVSLTVSAPCDRVWALIADPTQMSRWSPEAVRQRWLPPATSAVPGARFRGDNRNGFFRWSTISTVASVEHGRSITWDVVFQGLSVARWSLAVDPVAPQDPVDPLDPVAPGQAAITAERGSVLTQSFWDRRGRLMHVLGVVGRGVRDVPSHNRAGMQRTLAAMAAAAE